MYDALLDDFEDDATRTAEDEEVFHKLPVSAEEDDGDDTELEQSSSTSDGEVAVQAEEEEALPSADESESWSDDPVRMYLTQMGEIPLLTRQQEISLAKKIEVTRRRFRAKLLQLHRALLRDDNADKETH